MFPVVADAYSYSQLLGLHLGGGRLDAGERLWITCRGAPRDVPDEVATAIRLVALDAAIRRRRLPAAGALVECRWASWPSYLPQVAPDAGPVDLEPWQRDLVDREPEAFLRGLIAARGTRVVNRFSTGLSSGRRAVYAYPRYFFSARSVDVQALFCAACDRIGVDWTQGTARTISIAQRESVALLDAFVESRSDGLP